MRIYLSGAISNDPNHKAKFEAAKRKYEQKGYEVLSPIETAAYRTRQSNQKCFFAAIELLKQADVVVQLDDPVDSRGMQIEEAIADYCGIPVLISKVPTKKQ